MNFNAFFFILIRKPFFTKNHLGEKILTSFSRSLILQHMSNVPLCK